MRELEAILRLIISMLLYIPKFVVWTLGVVEAIFRVTKNTINYFVEQVVEEVTKKEREKDAST